MSSQIGHDDIVTNGLIYCVDPANKKSYLGSGTSVNNVVGNNTGSISGATFGNNTFSFDGSNDRIDCGNASSLSLTSNFSLCAWMKSSDQNNYAVALGKTDSNGYSMQMRAQNNTFRMNINDGSWKTAYYTVDPIDDGNWYCVIGTHDGSTIKIYVNAVKGTDASAGSATTNAASLYIGAESTGNYFKGDIGPVHIYNQVLSAAEVTQNFNAVRTRFGV